MAKLTAAAIKRIKPTSGRQELPDEGSDGLLLRVQPTGTKTWAMRFRRPNGKQGNLRLGSVDESGKEASGEPQIGGHHTLAAARRLAAEVQRQRKMGIDVITQLKEQEDREVPLSFHQAAVEFLDKYAAKNQRRWKDTARGLGLRSSADGWEVIKDGPANAWRDRPIAEVTGRDVSRALEATVERGSPYAANAQLAALRKMFNWLRERHLIGANPCDGIKPPTKPKPRERVLTDDEVRRLWSAWDGAGEPWTTLFKVLLLTGQRRKEIAWMEWSELNPDGTERTVPGARTKNHRPHVVPLVPAVRDLLDGVPRIEGCNFVFSTNGRTPVSGFSKAKARVDTILARSPDGPINDWRLHDLRRTAATGMAREGIALPVIERALNHVSGSFGGIVGVYQRHEYADEKREALEKWADLVTKISRG